MIDESKAKSDNLRKAMRFLAGMTPLTRDNYIKEIQLELNTWLKNADSSKASYSPPSLLRDMPQDLLAAVECESAVALRFGYWDVDYLFEQRIMNKLSAWIAEYPLKDNLIAPIVEGHKKDLDVAAGLQLEEACKLFDWTVRNISMDPTTASVEHLSDNPVGIGPDGFGYGYLPWESLLFSSGDFVERGRVFTALAQQRGIETFWIAVDAAEGSTGKLWAVGALIDNKVFVFDPRLGLPLLEPDTPALATLDEAISNPRVLRRLDLPGQFDYALEPEQLKSMTFLVDAPPVSASVRMKLLESSLLGEERMSVFREIDALQDRLLKIFPDTAVELWRVPAFAQIHAGQVREMVQTTTTTAMQYMTIHGVWLSDNPAANGRLKHLVGEFENTDEGGQGALDMYMDTRVDNERIEKLVYDPEVQRELGVFKETGESPEQFQMKVMQAQMVLGRAKLDASYLLAQLHFDRSKFSASQGFLKRVLKDERAQSWHAGCWYTLARIQQEEGDIEGATESFTKQPSPQEAGNRLRLRYLRRAHEN